ncbi:response regulator [Blautia liquoris]|uniref:Stage 0 sporulation protein A homolog n=1 Tax=Blautia liquoris TaxID=2779518 RepID=A0A7M2RHP1_9FIRM|nr:response regulator [Blautia liquoris]QOV18860.1 response regulator [Blautia liquoris]
MKVLIVEDEILSRIGLRQLIDWESLGLELLEDAKDGEEALRTIDSECPEIILLDLNIPKVDGMQILKQMNNYHYEHRVIIISCNEEFDKVKDALKLGAYDYLRKLNLSQGELLLSLKKCIKELVHNDSEEEREGAVVTKIKYEDLLNEGKHIFSINCSYKLLLFVQLQIEDNFIGNSLELKSEEFLSSNQVDAVIIQKDSQSCFFLFPVIYGNLFMERWRRFLEDLFHVNVYMGYVDHVINDTQKLFDNLVLVEQIHALCYYDDRKFLWRLTGKLNISEHSPKGMIDLINNLRKEVDEFKQKESSTCIHDVFSLIRDTHYTSVNVLRRIFMDILGIFSITAQNIDGAIEEIYVNGDNCHYQKIMMMNSLSKIEEWLLDFEDEFFKYFFVQYKCSHSDILKRAFDYIHEHLYQQIQLSDAAKNIGVSAAYLSTIFKKEIGQNFIEYTNIKKIETSKELLKKGEMVYEVSDALGFENSTYFSKVFKKYEGVSPDMYRRTGKQTEKITR